MTLAILLSVLAFGPMLLEARRSALNERRLRAAGAVEPPRDVYRLMRVAYPAAFLAMIAEGFLRGRDPASTFLAGAVVFAAGKALKYWAIATLGPRWTFRVLVPRGSVRIGSGPYRFLRHPNYAGVACELAGMALMAGAPLAGTLGTAAFLWLIVLRVRIEERAWGPGGVESGHRASTTARRVR